MNISYKIKYLKDWAKDKNELYIKAMLVFADLPNILCPLFNDYFGNLRKLRIINISDTDKWLSYYKNPQQINDALIHLLINEEKALTRNVARLFIRDAPAFEWPVDDFLIQIKETAPPLWKFIEDTISNDQKNKLENIELEYEEESTEIGYINDYPELVFVVRVIFPCLILYGDSHLSLYKKAVEGDIESFCDLLRIDKMIISDTNLSEYLRQMNINPRSPQSNKINNALLGSYRPMNLQQFKMRAGSYIDKTSKTFGFSLSAKDIGDILEDSSAVFKNEPVDPDQIITAEAIMKYRQRYRGFWKFME